MNRAEQNYSAIMQRYGGIPFTLHARIDDLPSGNTPVQGQGEKTAENASESVDLKIIKRPEIACKILPYLPPC